MVSVLARERTKRTEAVGHRQTPVSTEGLRGDPGARRGLTALVFGSIDQADDLIYHLGIEAFLHDLVPTEVEPGMQVDTLPEGCTTQGLPDDALFTVTEVYPSHVVLDGNHPLAGMALRLHLRVRGVREANDDEIEARSVGQGFVSVLDGRPGDSAMH